MKNRLIVTDFLIIGGGIAGMDLALRLAAHGEVLILTKDTAGESNSLYAQGGIAAVLDPTDRIEAHIEDTLTAGAGLCNPSTVQFVVEHGAGEIQRLIDMGVLFTKEGDNYHLTREGGHSARRVIHTADATGKAVVELLLERVQKHPNIHLLTDQIVVDLITAHKLGLYRHGRRNRCYGCHALDQTKGLVNTYQARFTILATGGAGKVYLYTSNPDTATGDGIAMAYRAGCRVANMEFIQFHPTCLYHPQAKSFLISEAVRGEGGVLLTKSGNAFMERHHPKKELAPRDVVARAIDFEMKKSGDDCVFLDISHKGKAFIREHFPNINKRCLELGITMSKEPIPVVPAAHYTCGGVVTNLDGKTDLDGLYAIGEVSHTGLHGANRLASNSILECLVFSGSSCRHILKRIEEDPAPTRIVVPLWENTSSSQCEEAVMITHNWEEIRRCMWNYVGIVRSDRRLARARRRVELITQEINEYYWNCPISRDLAELRNIAQVAMLIIRSAIQRRESRGLHYSTNYPEQRDASSQETILTPAIHTASDDGEAS